LNPASVSGVVWHTRDPGDTSYWYVSPPRTEALSGLESMRSAAPAQEREGARVFIPESGLKKGVQPMPSSLRCAPASHRANIGKKPAICPKLMRAHSLWHAENGKCCREKSRASSGEIRRTLCGRVGRDRRSAVADLQEAVAARGWASAVRYARGLRMQNSLPSGSRSTCQRPPA
jgi:hypothetical protein